MGKKKEHVRGTVFSFLILFSDKFHLLSYSIFLACLLSKVEVSNRNVLKFQTKTRGNLTVTIPIL